MVLSKVWEAHELLRCLVIVQITPLNGDGPFELSYKQNCHEVSYVGDA